MISIGLTARTEEEAADTAAGIIANAEGAMDIATTMNPRVFVDQDCEEATVEVEEVIRDFDEVIKDPAIKDFAKGNAMSVDNQDAGRSIIPGRNEDDLLITSASNTTS